MIQKNFTTMFNELLLECLSKPDPMLHLLEWLCKQLMEAEVNGKLGACRSERTDTRSGYRSGYRARRWDTRMGTMYLLIPKLRNGGYIPSFMTVHRRSEAALIQTVQEAYINGVSTRRMESLVKRLGIDCMSRSQVSEIAKGLNDQAEEFRTCHLDGHKYPVIWADALYEKVRSGGRVVSMAVLVVCGVNEEGKRKILAVEPMAEESEASYTEVFRKLKDRGMGTPKLVISDAHTGLVSAIRKEFPGASWQRCKVHFMRNILALVPQREKGTFAAGLKEIWLAPDEAEAKKRAEEFIKKYIDRYPRAIKCLEEGLDDSLSFYSFPSIEAKKISSTNMLERLNREIRRRTRVVGIFPNEESYTRLVTMYLIEYSEDWSVTRGGYFSPRALRPLLDEAD